jgi:hypothetical protein
LISNPGSGKVVVNVFSGSRSEKAVAGGAAVQSLRWSGDDQDDDPRHVAHDDHRFLTVGSALLLSGSVLHGDTARGIGLVAAGVSTGVAALAVGMGAYTQSSRSLFLHPGPAVLTATAALAWWGAL